jgi:voltage-gated potassium channel Kch
MVCEPQPIYALQVVDKVCVIIFTIEFGARVLTCWAVPARVANVLPSDWDEMEELEAREEHRASRLDPPPYSWYYQVGQYLLLWNSWIDVLAVIPFYVQLSGVTSTSLSFVRVLRLVRVLRFLKMLKSGEYVRVLYNTLIDSIPALMMMAFLVLLLVVFYGSVMYSCESGTFQVMHASNTTQWRYMTKDVLGKVDEVSAFVSIPAGIYWAGVTTTTLGYGDLVPTSPVGRALACFAMYLGILVLAMPIGVIGGNFMMEYEKMLDERKLRKQYAQAESVAIRASISLSGGDAAALAAALDDDDIVCDPLDLLREFVEYHRSKDSEVYHPASNSNFRVFSEQ